MKHGKKYTEAAKQVDRSVAYEPADAIALAKKTATAKFDETIEVHIRTGCDGRHAEQQIRGAVVLPNGTGKTVRVLVFAKGDKVNEAEAAGADYVGGDDLIPRIQNEGWLDCMIRWRLFLCFTRISAGLNGGRCRWRQNRKAIWAAQPFSPLQTEMWRSQEPLTGNGFTAS